MRGPSAGRPEFSASARRLSVAAVAGIPLPLASQIIGTLNPYSTDPLLHRATGVSDREIGVAVVPANVSTSYLVNASELRQQEYLRESAAVRSRSWGPGRR